MALETLDVLIVGAGISGIGAGYHLGKRCPDKHWAIFEARADLGGTWDLFRYPGVRSDSDMHTLGFEFKPWTSPRPLADGAAIKSYLRETASEYGIDKQIRYHHKVLAAAWSSADSLWTVRFERSDADGQMQPGELQCRILYMCSGYYDYEQGHEPSFPGIERFGGRIVHPQHWPPQLDMQGKRIVVIGSGATAVTLVPELADEAAHVTMLQRSPTWMLSRPGIDPLGLKLRRWLPARWVARVLRAKSIALSQWFYWFCMRKPERARAGLLAMTRAALGAGYDVDQHFTPRYNPWQQRLCLMPDGDLFRAIRDGRAAVATDTIKTFDESGIVLASGEHLDADIVVTATGLKLKFLAGIQVSLDGEPVDLAQRVYYKGMMLSGLPNLVLSFGYANASWTLKADLTSRYVCRLLQHMDRTGTTQAVPRIDGQDIAVESRAPLSAGYLLRAAAYFPKQGDKRPWRVSPYYLVDLFNIRFGRLEDGVLSFSGAKTS